MRLDDVPENPQSGAHQHQPKRKNVQLSKSVKRQANLPPTLMAGSKGVKSRWVYPSSSCSAAALRTMESSASRGGSHHLAAAAAACSTECRSSPSAYSGQSSCARVNHR